MPQTTPTATPSGLASQVLQVALVLGFLAGAAMLVVQLQLAVHAGGTLVWSGEGWELTRAEAWRSDVDSELAVGDRLVSLEGEELGPDDLIDGFDYLVSAEEVRRWFQRNGDRYRLWEGRDAVEAEVLRADGGREAVLLAHGTLPPGPLVGRILPWLVVAVGFLGTAIVLLRRAPPGGARNAFIVCNVGIAVAVLTYPGCVFGKVLAYQPAMLEGYLLANTFGASLGVSALAVFFLRFPTPIPVVTRIPGVDRLLLPACAVFGVASMFFGLFRPIQPNVAVIPLILLTAVLLGVQIWGSLRLANPTARWQVSWLGLGILIPMVGWIGLVAIPRALGQPEHASPDLIALASVAVPITAGFAITRHRLLEVDLVIRRTVLAAALFLVFIAAYLLVTRLGLAEEYRPGSLGVVFLVALVLLFLPLLMRLEALYDRIVNPRTAAQQQSLLELSARLARDPTRERLARRVVDLVAESFDPTSVALFVAGRNHEPLRPLATRGRGAEPQVMRMASAALRALENGGEPYLIQEAGEQPDGEVPAGGPPEALLVIPLRGPLGLAGVLVCGPRRSGKRYGAADLRMLTATASQAALYLENLRMADEISELRELERELARRQQWLALDALSAEVAHEIRYPLNFFENFLRFKAQGQPLTDEELELGATELARLKRLLEQLGGTGSALSPVREPTPVLPLMRTCVRVLEATLDPAIEIDVQVPPELTVAADPHGLQQVMLNLLNNAAEAMGPGRIRVRASRDGDEVSIRVEDQGPGVPEELRDRIFEPLFTTRASGSGLGLAICARIARRHGGSIALAQTSGSGSTFEVTLPAAG